MERVCGGAALGDEEKEGGWETQVWMKMLLKRGLPGGISIYRHWKTHTHTHAKWDREIMSALF